MGLSFLFLLGPLPIRNNDGTLSHPTQPASLAAGSVHYFPDTPPNWPFCLGLLEIHYYSVE